jgi:thiamine pyrophosphate-dependent acetolactate synthase large subunit-like protein
MFVHEAIAQEIREHGVEVVFGLLGNDTEKLAAELLRLGVAFCPAHHEAQAVDMATGYSRASGRLCVAVLNRGPGLTNAINALTLVAKSRSRVLAVCGDASTRLAKRRDAARIDAKHVDQAMLCSSVGAILVRPISADTVVADTRAALELATRGGAVVLAVPDDIIGSGTYGQPGSGAGKGVEAGAGAASVEFPSPVKPPTPKAEEVSIVADLLETGWAASRPVILAGHGAFLAGAGPALQRLGELTGAVLATTLVARSLFEGDPYNVGICGSFASPIASDLIASSDCVLCFGASLNDHTTYGKTIFSHARVIQVDCQETAFGLFMEPEVAMHCDAAAAATALVEELERRAPRGRTANTRN